MSSENDIDTMNLEKNINYVAKLGDLYPKEIDKIKESQGKKKRKIGAD